MHVCMCVCAVGGWRVGVLYGMKSLVSIRWSQRIGQLIVDR